jgi:hypothetical protein
VVPVKTPPSTGEDSLLSCCAAVRKAGLTWTRRSVNAAQHRLASTENIVHIFMDKEGKQAKRMRLFKRKKHQRIILIRSTDSPLPDSAQCVQPRWLEDTEPLSLRLFGMNCSSTKREKKWPHTYIHHAYPHLMHKEKKMKEGLMRAEREKKKKRGGGRRTEGILLSK